MTPDPLREAAQAVVEWEGRAWRRDGEDVATIGLGDLDRLLERLTALRAALAQPAPAALLAVAYPRGHGLSDYCDEHGEIERTVSIKEHLMAAHGMTEAEYDAYSDTHEWPEDRAAAPAAPLDRDGPQDGPPMVDWFTAVLNMDGAAQTAPAAHRELADASEEDKP